MNLSLCFLQVVPDYSISYTLTARPLHTSPFTACTKQEHFSIVVAPIE